MTSDKKNVGTGLTIQTGTGFLLSVVSVYVIPILQERVGWAWLFSLLAPGPALALLCAARVLFLQRDRQRARSYALQRQSRSEAASLQQVAQ